MNGWGLWAGKLQRAVQTVAVDNPHGPWYILCDNEAFLHSFTCRQEYRRQNLHLRKIPAKSPDLNPVERFWAYLKRRLRALDLKDALRRRPSLGKLAYKARVRTVLQSRSAQTAAKNIVKAYRKTCQEIVRTGGAASSS